MGARDTNKNDTSEATASTTAADASTTEDATAASSKPAEPQRVIIEQAPAEPAVFYGEGGIVPGSGSATDPNKPHVKANYQPFDW
ncbi:hypothetical protein SEA_PAITO_62 [Mycobacterium phage Paito]|uniref:Uncharacterized protein n=1 Tax=Mycobacterium phage Paito TaxID=2315544 RepID=A0A386KHC8_9CAUD|nr:hypothetical protein KDW68_gp62 [Mycobacterium phage Paito]AYD84646.1 hypothetical protein SEA_PAITO_62 [Mycobacterium phage Paito]